MTSIKKSGALLWIDSSDQMLPRGDNEDCREAVYISYSWRGIIRGLQALNKRSWRMGDATHTYQCIWMGPWILFDVSRKPVATRGWTVLTKMSELIDC